MPNIAIVGMSVRVPGAEDPEAFWRNLCGGKDAITHFAPEALHWRVQRGREAHSPAYVRARGVLADIEGFDAPLFDFTPREAQITDPQHRVLLECAWEALERAGYDPRAYPGLVGVFAGVGVSSYLLFNLLPAGQLDESVAAFQAFLHNKPDHVATRIAYKLGFAGPAITVQTACSTSLVSVVLACQALATWQCDAALAGGASVFVPQASGYLYFDGGIGSPDGRCRPFDADAAGTVPGNGAGIVMLKRLADALRDGDPVLAVIRGWNVNNDGHRRVGYTAPGTEGQLEVVVGAQELAEVAPDTIGYVEAHGTGTALGDPIEFEALRLAFRRASARTGFCAVGAVKGNIGHLDAAAGVAGLVKTVLVLAHRQIPPAAHFAAPNPRCDLANSPFYVATSLQDWPSGPTPRRAAVSSFGLGGTNAHVVLEEPPARAPIPASSPYQLLVLSGQSAAALEAATARLAAHLRAHDDQDLGDIAWTLQAGRARHAHRRALVARDLGEARRLLEDLDPAAVVSRTQREIRRQPVFMFPGEGAPYPGMGRGLAATESVYRATLEWGLAALPAPLVAEMRALLFEDPIEERAAAVLRPDVAQPALFLVEYGLAKLWMSFGVRPAAVVGCGLGELSAAAVAGVMAPEDALQLAAERGRLLGTLPEGAMLAVRASERRLRAILPAELALGGIDGAESCVVAGAPDAVAAFGARLCAEGLVASSLPMVRAYHSGAVEAVMPAWRERLAAVALRAPAIPFMSTLNGHWADEREIATADYWARQLREPVRFHAAVERLLEDPAAAFLEVGPGRTLRSLVRWHPHKRPEHVAVACLPRAGESGEDRPRLLRAVGALWLAGVVLDWAALHAGDARRRVELPTYPFQRTRHWIEASPAGETAAQPRDAQRERAELADWFWVPRWREAPLPGGTPATAARGETWLIFASATPVVRALVDQLRAAEAVVLVVEAGTGWREVGPGHFEIDASAAADYQTLLTRLAALGRVPARIIHAWSLDATSADAQERGFFSLVALARALMRVERAPVTLVALTAGMHDLGDDELGVAEQATVLGPVRVIPREQSHVLCKSLDLPVRVRGVGDMARVVDLVLAECMARTAERMVAVRGPHRWVQDYERRSLAPATSLSPVLRAGGTYLITGGLGGIGLAVAAWIAEAAPDVHLVLTGRSAFPAAEAWDAWLAERGADDPTSRRIRALRRLIDLGAVVSVESVDAGDASGMAALVERTIARRGALHGIVHAAGVAGGGLLALRPRDAMLSVLEPKVRGARVLAGIASGVPLDFLVFCSSRTAVGGRAGQVDYVGANAFLDVLAAHLRRSTSAHVVAVDWPAWEQVGMAARANGRREIPEADERQAFGRHPMLTWRLPGKAGVETFATRFSAHEHWPLDEHRIIGRAVMPGVAYFDMVRAALADRCEGRMVVLREVLFREPMHLEDDETREGRLEIRDEGKAEFSFRVWSEETSAPSRRQREHAAGRAALEAPGSRPRCDLAAIRARCPVEVVVAQEDREDDLGPRWQSVRSFRRGHQEVLIELELPEAFAGDWDQWFFHPALLDRAAGLTKKQLCPEHYYLPLVYQGVAMCRPLRGRIFVHGRRLPELEASNEETITFAFDLVDPDGEHLAWVERFVQKRVGDPGAQIRGMADPGPEPAAAAGNAGIHPAQAVEALARVLAAHVEPQVVVSPEDLPSFLTREDWELAGRVLDPAAAPAATPPVPESFTPPLEALTAANSIEARVTELWSEVLGIQSIGLHQDFFEAGGDSLTAIQLLSRIQTAFGVSLAVDALFRAPTIAGVSALVVEEMVSTVTSLPQSELAQRTEAAGEPVPDLPS